MASRAKEMLCDFDGSLLGPLALLALSRVFGTEHSLKGTWSFGSANAWRRFEHALSSAEGDLASALWHDQLLPVLTSRLQYCGPSSAARLYSEIKASLRLIGATPDEVYRAAAIAIPEPKAWRKLPGYVPEDLDLALPDDAFGPLPDVPDLPFAPDDPEALLADVA